MDGASATVTSLLDAVGLREGERRCRVRPVAHESSSIAKPATQRSRARRDSAVLERIHVAGSGFAASQDMTSHTTLRALLVSLLLGTSACGGSTAPPDAEPLDGGSRDASFTQADASDLPDGARVDGGPDGSLSGPDGGSRDETVRIYRDARGVPFIEASDFESALYGLGYVQAEDRLFQMHRARVEMRGQLAEVFGSGAGDAASRARDSELLALDRRRRIMGFAASAERTVAGLPDETRRLLQAYADGVNAQVATRGDTLGTAFSSVGIRSISPWTAADCLLVWDVFGDSFGNPLGAIESEIAQLARCEAGSCAAAGCPAVVDEETAVVPPPADGTWPPSSMGVPPSMAGLLYDPRPEVPRKASHGFVVAAELVVGGRALMFAEPQLPLIAPSFWHEFVLRVAAEGLELRGMGFPGAPGVVVFWNQHVAQSATAGRADIADLFEIQERPGGYLVDGAVEPFTERVERLVDASGVAETLVVRETRYGPVVDPLLPGAPAGRHFAMRHAEMTDETTHTVVAALELMRADGLASYRDALRHWTAPSLNLLYAGHDRADDASHIAFHAATRIPRRAPIVRDGLDLTGRLPYNGSRSSFDWSGFWPLEQNPHVIDPPSGYLFSGNHLPVGLWYDATTYGGFGGSGDTFRSMELRFRLPELLEDGPASVDALHALHVHSGSIVAERIRDALRVLRVRGTIPRDEARPPTTPAARASRLLTALERWTSEGAELRHGLDSGWMASELVRLSAALARPSSDVSRAFICRWGGGEPGVSFFLRRFGESEATLGGVEADFLILVADVTWRAVETELGAEVSRWGERDVPPTPILYQAYGPCWNPAVSGESCSLDPRVDLEARLDRAVINTINSAASSSYPATVEVGRRAYALLPPGVSEDPRSPWFASGIDRIEDKADGLIASIPEAPSDPDGLPLTTELVR
jgi:penicillin amidase